MPDIQLWRVHIKPASDQGADPRDLCFRREKVVGFGWSVGEQGNELTWEDYKRLALPDHQKYRGLKAVETLRSTVNQDDLVWSRDWNADHWLGRITGDWE